MGLDIVANQQRRLPECWLYRCADRSPYAYARGHEFIRCGDHTLWAQLCDDRLVSVRSGGCLAYRVGATFYDPISHEAVYYKPSSFSFPLQRASAEKSDAQIAENVSLHSATKVASTETSRSGHRRTSSRSE